MSQKTRYYHLIRHLTQKSQFGLEVDFETRTRHYTCTRFFFSSKGRFSETWMITWGIQMKLWRMTLSSVKQICKVLAIFLPRIPNFRHFLTVWKLQYAISRCQLGQHCCSFSTDNNGSRTLLCKKSRFPMQNAHFISDLKIILRKVRT